MVATTLQLDTSVKLTATHMRTCTPADGNTVSGHCHQELVVNDNKVLMQQCQWQHGLDEDDIQ